MKRKISAFISLIMLVLSVATPLAQALELDTAIFDEYEIQGDKVVPKIGSVFSDLNVWGTALLRVFTDNTKTKTLSPEDKLVDGSIVEIEEDGAFAYFTVYSPIQELLFAPQNASEYGSVARGAASDVSGAFGKDESDYCVYLNSTGADGSSSKFSCYKDVVVGAFSDDVWSYSGTEGYIIIEASIVTKTGTAFQMLTNSNSNFFTDSRTVAINANVWNKVYIVYDFETQKAKRIINGEESDWIDSNFGKNNKTALRLYFEGEANNTGAYIDDLTVYISKRMPKYIAPPVLDEAYSISENKLTSDGTITVGDIVSDDAVVKVFSDYTYAERLDDDVLLETGNIILLEKEGVYNVYSVTVSDGDDTLISWSLINSSVTLPSGITVEANVGGGKDASDDALCYPSGAKYLWNGGSGENFAFTKPASNMTTYTGYMIMQMNIMSPVTTKSFAIKSNSNVAVAGREYPSGTQPIVMPVTSTYGFAQNRWNHVVIVWRLNNGAYNTENMTVYVNGTQQAQQVHRLYSSGYTQFRIYAEGEGNIYFDDVTIDFTELQPNIAKLTAMPELTGIDGMSVEEFAISLTGDVTLSALQAANTNTVTAYTASDFATKLTDESKLESGNVVVVTDSRGNMSYYNVQ